MLGDHLFRHLPGEIEGQVSTMLGMLRRANDEDSDPAHVPERAGIDTGGGG
jgi:hypothetical protein